MIVSILFPNIHLFRLVQTKKTGKWQFREAWSRYHNQVHHYRVNEPDGDPVPWNWKNLMHFEATNQGGNQFLGSEAWRFECLTWYFKIFQWDRWFFSNMRYKLRIASCVFVNLSLILTKDYFEKYTDTWKLNRERAMPVVPERPMILVKFIETLH